jgi:hypothetical protein
MWISDVFICNIDIKNKHILALKLSVINFEALTYNKNLTFYKCKYRSHLIILILFLKSWNI